MKCLRYVLSLLVLLSAGAFASRASAGVVDIKFVHISDPHYLTEYTNCTAKTALVNRINALPTKTLPNSTELVGKIWGVLATGDLTDAYATGQARTNQWLNFIKDYGFDGTDGLLNFPVYEGWGNHDQDSWSAVQDVYIPTRNKTRPGVVNYSGPHYSWDWGPVHLVQLNMRCGGTARYNAKNSYAFLTNDLATFVGNSGRPVILMHHLNIGAATGDWPTADQTAYYEAVTNYNVIAVLWGHLGGSSSVGKWNSRIRTVFTGGGQDTVFRITDNQLKIMFRTTGGAWSTVTTDTISVPVTPPQITRAAPEGGNLFGLQVDGDNCLDYTLQYSDDLNVWSDLYTTNSLTMPLKFLIADPPAAMPRFFRARLGP